MVGGGVMIDKEEEEEEEEEKPVKVTKKSKVKKYTKGTTTKLKDSDMERNTKTR